MSSKTRPMHGSKSTVENVRNKLGEPFHGFLYRRGWRGHPELELARRRRRNKAAKLSRKRNRAR